jgi:hypothetical protein
MVETCHIDRPELNRQLKEVILQRRESDPGVVCHNKGGWHSQRDVLSWGDLCIHVLTEVIVDHGPKDAELVLAWANVNEAGDFNAPHIHQGGGWVLSGYYVVAGETGDTVFTPGDFRVQPRPGVLVFFQPYQKHHVEPCDEQRISIAFNFARIARRN